MVFVSYLGVYGIPIRIRRIGISAFINEQINSNKVIIVFMSYYRITFLKNENMLSKNQKCHKNHNRHIVVSNTYTVFVFTLSYAKSKQNV